MTVLAVATSTYFARADELTEVSGSCAEYTASVAETGEICPLVAPLPSSEPSISETEPPEVDVSVLSSTLDRPEPPVSVAVV